MGYASKITSRPAVSAIASGGAKVATGLVDDALRVGADDVVNAGTKAVSNGSKLASNGARLNSHLSQLEKYGKAGQKTLENGRIRYYGEITKANKPGEMFGRRVVREWDPITNNKRLWMETLDNAGRIRQVRPQFGSVKGKHYLFDSASKLIGVWQ